MKTNKKYISLIILLAAAVACTVQDGLLPPDEIGVIEENVVLESAPGVYGLKVLSDGVFTARLAGEDSWLRFEGTSLRSISGSGDLVLNLEFDYNRGLSRTAVLTLERGRRSIGVNIRQEGILSDKIELASHSVSVPEDGQECSVKILSLYSDDDLVITVDYDGTGGWVQDVRKVNNFVKFTVDPNPSELSRTAYVTVTSKDDDSISDKMQICQMGRGSAYTEMSLADLKTKLTAAGTLVVEEDWVIEGVVSSDDSEGNGGENLSVSASLQDFSRSARTVYIQNAEATHGLRLLFDSAQDNILRRYDKAEILLKGTSIKRLGGTAEDPLRFEITGLKASNVISSASGSAYDLTPKEKYMDELTDSDVYTYVTLKDCEIPVRKGPFVPIDLRHRQLIHSYPMVIRDIKGSTSHLMTNLGASWERDGEGIPQGSGSISGVIVHESCDNFEWDGSEAMRRQQEGILQDYITGIGNIGKYQIRPIAKEEIRVSDDFEDGFSGLLMELRYYNKSNAELVCNVSGQTMYSTYPAVPDPLYDPQVKGRLYVVNSDGSKGNIVIWRDWTHLGPYENGEITDPARGNGVYDYYGAPAEFAPYSLVYNTALIMNSSAWYASAGWGPQKYWCASFSTEGLTSANFPISVQIGAESGLGRTVGAPRYWNLEYSVDGQKWTTAASYTVPDFPVISSRKPWQCPGPKYVSINLPEDTSLLDRNIVYVRMRPSSTQAGTTASYDGGTIVEGRETAMNYFAVRYNK